MKQPPPTTKTPPHFIIDKPEGKDLFEGKSQDRIADNIEQYITENKTINRKVIGIEGEWGSGKSNVIEILKGKLKNKFYFFVFDAWGHQEDLTRRSILEELLSKLIKDKVLDDEKTWNEKLANLLAKKVETKQKNVPQLSTAILLTLAGILLMPITKFRADIYWKPFTLSSPITTPYLWDYFIVSFILISSFIPLIAYVLRSLYKAEKGKKIEVLYELLYLYKGKEIVNTSEETISENEPTVLQFTKFLSKIEESANKDLVIVFDNMDRLPEIKVKEIWSSIHTFFASDDYGLKTWAIVPFDNDHICNIFIDDDKAKANNNKSNHRVDSYIHKTFSIVFHVPPPSLSDWKDFFETKFKEAFGYAPPFGDNLETIFEYYHSTDPKIKPRDIICFMNDLVALKKIWNDEIPFKYLALFALKRDEILKNPYEILSRGYLGTLASIFENDENLDANVASLAFNVEPEFAEQIVSKRTIENALKGEGNLNLVSKKKSFVSIFDSAFYKTRLDIIHTINCLDEISPELKERTDMQNYWNKISDTILRIEIFDIKYTDAIIKIIQRLNDKKRIEQLTRFLFTNSIKNDASNNKFYYGSKYYDLITNINSILEKIRMGDQIEDFLPKSIVEPEEYFEFINVCPENYKKYKVACDIKKINDFLIGKFEDNTLSRYFKQLKTIKEVDLSDFKARVNGIIPTLTGNLPNFQIILSNIYALAEILSVEGKFAFVIPPIIANAMLIVNPTHERKADLLLSIIKEHMKDTTQEPAPNNNWKNFLNDSSFVSPIMLSYRHYFNYSDLIKYDLQFPNLLSKSVVVDLTNTPSEITVSEIGSLLSHYNEIKEKIFDNKIDSVNQFITKISNFYKKDDIGPISEDGLSYVISIIKDNSSLDCDLMNDIITLANEFINTVDNDTWILSLTNYRESKIIELIKVLIETGKYKDKKLPTSASLAYSSVINSIYKKEIPIPTDEVNFWDNFLELCTNVNLISTYQNVRDELLSHDHTIINEEWNFFERGLFQYGKLDEDQRISDYTLRRILIPLASNDAYYINIIKSNVNSIIKIVEKAKDSIIDFKTTLDSKCPTIFTEPDLKNFADILTTKSDLLLAELNIKNDEVKEETKEVIL